MNKLLVIASLLTLLLFSVSCNKEKIDYDEPDKKMVEVPIGAKISISVNVDVSAPITYAPVVVDVSNYVVRILKDASGEKVGEWAYNKLPEIITLQVGTYRIEVLSHVMKSAEWEKPYYFGSKQFTVEANKVSDIGNIECKFRSVKVKVLYSDDLLNELKDNFVVTVSNADGGLLSFTKNETRAAYFSPSQLKVVLNGERNDGSGEKINWSSDIKDVAAGQYREITMSVNFVDTPTPLFTVDMAMNVKDLNIKIPHEEPVIPDNPTPDPDPDPDPNPDPDPGVNAPAITGDGFNIKNAITYAKGSTKTIVVNLSAEGQIQDLWVEIDSPFLTDAELENLGIPKRFNLADLTPELKVAFVGLGLITDAPIRGTTSLVFNITTFTPLLDANTHKFHLSLTDKKGQSTTEILTLKVQ